MTSTVLPQKGSTVELPWKLLIAAAQPYQTLSGPALSVNFALQPIMMPFQRLPLHHSGVPGMYFHSLLQSLAEFATVPRPVRGSHVKMLHAPMGDFWHSVGLLNSVYYTMYPPFNPEHPAMGAVELTSSSHRKKKDIRLSLFGSTHQAVATMVLTGTAGDAYDVRESDTEVPLPHASFDGEVGSTTALVGDVKRLSCGSIFHSALFKGGKQCASEKGEDVVPPWQLDRCVADFCHVLAEAGLLAPHVVCGNNMRRLWTIVAQQTLAHGELLHEEPVDVVAAVPHVFAAYRMPPWRHQIGLPLFTSGNTYPVCVALRVEMRQHGNTMIAGTYFLVDVAAGA